MTPDDDATMPDDVDAIVQEELQTTEQSIANLDSICDTTLVGITFLFAGLATWGSFGLGRLSGASIAPELTWGFLLLVGLSGGTTTLAVVYIVKGLFPRQFYTEEVGETLLDSSWVPLSTRRTTQETLLARSRSTSAQEYVEHLLDGYDHRAGIDDHERFREVRLRNLKIVGGVKATATGKGLSWFRLGVILFLVSLLYGGSLVVFLAH